MKTTANKSKKAKCFFLFLGLYMIYESMYMKNKKFTCIVLCIRICTGIISKPRVVKNPTRRAFEEDHTEPKVRLTDKADQRRA